MSIEDAILRRIRLGQSFCSYTFKQLPAMRGKSVIKAQRDHRYLVAKSKLQSTDTMDTICLSASRLKSTARPSVQKLGESQKNSGEKENLGISILGGQRGSQIMSLHSFSKPDRMQEYLSDFHNLRSEVGLKKNKFEIIPKQKEPSHNPHPKTSSSAYRPASRNYARVPAESIAIQSFNPRQMRELFHDFSLEENCLDFPYAQFRMVGIGSCKWLGSSIGEKIFSEIPIKEYCHLLNKFSTRLEDNIFYISLSKARFADQSLPYTECFFWISKPIKHTERVQALKLILKFYTSSLKELDQQETSPKIWVVDFNGKISFITRAEVLNCLEDPEEGGKIKDQLVESNMINEVCLSMFLSSMKRGAFTNYSLSSASQTPQLPID